MVANGDAAKPIWLSEMNSNAVPEELNPRFGRVTLEQQARYAPLAYERIQQEWPWAGVATIWFFKRATDTERELPFYYFRLAEPDFTPMPVYESLSEYLNTLSPTLYAGRHQETAWQMAYEGPWEDVVDAGAVLGTYRRAIEPGARLSLAWQGRQLKLTPGPGQGTLRVTAEDGTSRDVFLHGEPVLLARGLFKERHALTLTAVEGEVTLDEVWVR